MFWPAIQKQGKDLTHCTEALQHVRKSDWAIVTGHMGYNTCFAKTVSGDTVKQLYILEDCADTLKLQ